ncbi:hypothetical protein [Halomonas getboli]|uniref:hypothetical protein n=1 Tax=Halomonas getboli TaxID=2935862 RepID=UPI001FFF80D8|nr:hypothetical protein [Halomonas getboli]MCK2185074.1 hypothetical protein [Halomonas getboli]
MNLQRAYALLAIFYTALLAVGVIAVVMGGGTTLALLYLAIGAVTVAGLWGYLRGRRVMSFRSWRPFVGVLVLGIAVSVWRLVAGSPSGTELTWLLAYSIFAAPPALLLFRYGDHDQDLWATPAELEGGEALSGRLEHERELTMQGRDAIRPAVVRVSREGGRYLARVERGRGEAMERFEACFRRPATLAFFIETFAGIDVREALGVPRRGLDASGQQEGAA